MNVEILDQDIYYYKNIIDDPYSLIEYIESLDSSLDENSPLSKWKEWFAYKSNYSFGKQKQFIHNLSNKNLPFYNESMYIHNVIYTGIMTAAKHYVKNHNNIDVGFLTPLTISKYFVGKHMGPHVDAHDDDPSKTISCVLYLNDNYEGGELNFPEKGFMIKPEAGSLIIFPSKCLHESKIIKSGVKYMAPGFWNKTLV
jgi:Rps23 Pro-64 3,4-dihydroxylase Tpa1-like proline 4-hydroxylase